MWIFLESCIIYRVSAKKYYTIYGLLWFGILGKEIYARRNLRGIANLKGFAEPFFATTTKIREIKLNAAKIFSLR